MLLKRYADIADHGYMIVYLKITVTLFQHCTYLSMWYFITTYSPYRFTRLLTLKFYSLDQELSIDCILLLAAY